MPGFDRRDFLRGTAACALTAAAPADLLAQATKAAAPASAWDSGVLRHLLPTVSHDRILIKASLSAPLADTPTLRIDSTSVRGRMGDTRGEHWYFYATGLKPGRPQRLSLAGAKGHPLCEPWQLATFPGPDERPETFRLLIYTCAGGHEIHKFLATATRNRLLRRALSFAPQAVVANGDHVYWDLLAPVNKHILGASPDAIKLAGTFDRSAVVLGHDNEAVLKRAAGPQIAPVYGTDFRSTPVFFVQDDHDHFDNDEATDEAVTFPPAAFMPQPRRATQHLYYPEFLPDAARPAGLPGGDAVDRPAWRPSGLSESFGTLRYGRVAEVLLYTVRRTMTLAGPAGVFVAPEVEAWIRARAGAREVAHLINVPSNPPGWSAGKWGEWYPDVLGRDGKLTTAVPKPYWQPGWLAQHDRLMRALSAMPERVPLVVSGDLHATAEGRMLRCGGHDFSRNPVVTVLPGTLGTSDGGWASEFRGVGPLPPAHLEMDEAVRPIEENGFTLIDLTPEAATLRYFRWNQKTQPIEAIDRLEPFHTTELKRG